VFASVVGGAGVGRMGSMGGEDTGPMPGAGKVPGGKKRKNRRSKKGKGEDDEVADVMFGATSYNMDSEQGIDTGFEPAPGAGKVKKPKKKRRDKLKAQ